MKFGILLPYDPVPGLSAPQRLERYLETVRLAREYGFASVAVTHHLLGHPQCFFQPFPLLARLSADAGQMLLVTYVLQLPLFNPVDLAEQVATLDVLTGGRVVLGVGMGWRESLFQAFGLRVSQRVSRFVESLRVMQRLWLGEQVDVRGKNFCVPGGRMALLPIQRPHLPIWVGAQTDQGVERAARLGFTWAPASNMTDPLIIQRLKSHRDTLKKHGHVVPGEQPLRKDAYLGSTREAALRAAAQYIAPRAQQTVQQYAGWGLDPATVFYTGLALETQQAVAEKWLVGTPEEVVDKIHWYEEEMGANHLILRLEWANMDRTSQVEQIRLWGDKVISKW